VRLDRGAYHTVQKRILIAEPNAYLSETFSELLSGFGYDVIGATADIAELNNRIRGFHPDLLLIDYDMTLRTDIGSIRAQFPKLKVVGFGFNEAIDGFSEITTRLGLDGFFSKYAPRDHLLKSIKTLLP